MWYVEDVLGKRCKECGRLLAGDRGRRKENGIATALHLVCAGCGGERWGDDEKKEKV